MALQDVLTTTRRRVAHALPTSVTGRLAGPYNFVQERRADLQFRRKSRPEYDPGTDAPRHVLCVVVDALRADVIDHELTPSIASLSGYDALTTAPWTFPAVTSLVTGTYPHEHGVVRGRDEFEGLNEQMTLPPTLPPEQLTLPETFAAAGYDTYGSFAFLMPFLALSGRFERHALYNGAPAETVLADYRDWLEGRERTFAYLHLDDPHLPVDPPDRYWDVHDVDRSIPEITTWAYDDVVDLTGDAARYRDHRWRLYQAAVDYVDDQIAGLREWLDDRGIEPALVIVGDHGEAFWEHAAFDADHFVDTRPAYGTRHGGTPYEAIARVPFRVSGIECQPQSTDVSLVDLAPTLVSSAGLTGTLETTGSPLQTALPSDRKPIVESARYGYEKKAVYRDDWKLIVSRGDDVTAGFSLPEETPTALPDDVLADLEAALPPWPDGSVPEVAVSGTAQRRLEDLGYV